VIDFKQFLTTIAAIFLALAVGVALGAGPLKGTADEQLRINAEKLSKDKDTLQLVIKALREADDIPVPLQFTNYR